MSHEEQIQLGDAVGGPEIGLKGMSDVQGLLDDITFPGGAHLGWTNKAYAFRV